MATKKVKVPASWNAKPVTKLGGKPSSPRNPGKPYSKPAGKPSAAKPAPKPAAKPNSKASAPASNTRPGGAITMPNSARAGVNLPKTGARAERTATQIKQLRQASKPAAKAAGKAALKSLAGKALMVPAIASQVADVAGGFNKLANHPFLTKNKDKPSSGGSGRSSRPGTRTGSNTNTYSPTPAPQSSRFRGSTGTNRQPGRSGSNPERQGPAIPDRLRNAPAAPQLPPPTQAATPRRSSGGGSMPSAVTRKPSSSAPKAPAAPAKPTERRVSASTANRESGNYGTSKTNNPLMKDFVGRMKDREDKAQASAASKVTSKFNTESNFSAEKVDGSKVDTKAKMKSTTSEYDKKKRRYGG